MSGDAGAWSRLATVTLTALLISSAFVVFFSQASEAADVTASSSSSVTHGNDIDVTVKIDLDSDERIPIEEVALKIQRQDNAKLLKDIRWNPTCSSGSFSLLSGYDEDVASTSGCTVKKGGSSSEDSSDIHGYGYLRGDDLGYGYTSGEGYGYFESSREVTHTDGYGYGYGYADGSSSLEWTVTVDTSDLPTTDVETVGLVDTGSTALGDFQSDKTANVVTVGSSGGGGTGGGGGGAGAPGKAIADVATSGCRPSCDLGDLTQDAQVYLDAAPGDDAFVNLSFETTERITDAKLEFETRDIGDPPSGVDAPPANAPAKEFIRIEFKNGTEDAGDMVRNVKLEWKLPDAWISGDDAPDRDFPLPDDVLTLLHWQPDQGEYVPEGATPIDAPDDGDESTYDYFETELDHLSTFATGAEDDEAPTFSNARPEPATDERRPTVGVDYSDDGVGVDTSNVTITVDGTDVTDQASVTQSGVTYTPSPDLAFGDHDVTVTASDLLGNEGTRSWTFEVVEPDDQAPTVTSVNPEDGSTVSSDAAVEATYEDAGSPASGVDADAVTLTVDGTDVTGQATVNASGIHYTPDDGFEEGTHNVTLELADRVGNEETETWSFTVEVQEEGEGFPWTILVGVLVILGIAGAIGGYLYQNPEAADRLRERIREASGGRV
jgi:hypothetical protein